jgi:hypothetical protein
VRLRDVRAGGGIAMGKKGSILFVLSAILVIAGARGRGGRDNRGKGKLWVGPAAGATPRGGYGFGGADPGKAVDYYTVVLAPSWVPGLAATPGQAPLGARSLEALVASSAFFTATPHGGLRRWEPGGWDRQVALKRNGMYLSDKLAKSANAGEPFYKEEFSLSNNSGQGLVSRSVRSATIACYQFLARGLSLELPLSRVLGVWAWLWVATHYRLGC